MGASAHAKMATDIATVGPNAVAATFVSDAKMPTSPSVSTEPEQSERRSRGNVKTIRPEVGAEPSSGIAVVLGAAGGMASTRPLVGDEPNQFQQPQPKKLKRCTQAVQHDDGDGRPLAAEIAEVAHANLNDSFDIFADFFHDEAIGSATAVVPTVPSSGLSYADMAFR